MRRKTVVESVSVVVDCGVPMDVGDAVVGVVEETGQDEVWTSTWSLVVTVVSKDGYQIHLP